MLTRMLTNKLKIVYELWQFYHQWLANHLAKLRQVVLLTSWEILTMSKKYGSEKKLLWTYCKLEPSTLKLLSCVLLPNWFQSASKWWLQWLFISAWVWRWRLWFKVNNRLWGVFWLFWLIWFILLLWFIFWWILCNQTNI